MDIKKMTTKEKLKIMELLWDDICRDIPNFSSPQWHEKILNEREKNLKQGNDKFVDWNKAKKDILDSIA